VNAAVVGRIARTATGAILDGPVIGGYDRAHRKAASPPSETSIPG